MSDGKFFTTTKKGEIHELQMELNQATEEQRKDAVKKVIAGMTVGKDVSVLFPDVVKCMQTNNVELKKLVYLYIINYAKTQPDLAILAVNTFVKDSQNRNPLVRALAIRTMGCIRVDKITEYLLTPVLHALDVSKEDDPYVRKTAAIAVAKLYDINSELVEQQGMIASLQGLLSDPNPAVVANAVAALCEIQETSTEKVFKVTASTLHKLLAALNECTEWGQVFVLDSLVDYEPADTREAESIIERVVPRLQHVNAAVVLSAVKIVLKFMGHVSSSEAIRTYHKKLSPPLVSLLSSEPEIQYVALRNINLVVQRAPKLLANDIRVFFCKYNDPVYVKIEKLEILVKLASERNLDQVLQELKEYATEIDVEFVRRAVHAIGNCAIKLDRGADRCVDCLMELIRTKVPHIVQESIVVMKDIFRKYPERYEGILATLAECSSEGIEEPHAVAALMWIVGEYCDKVPDVERLLTEMVGEDDEDDEDCESQNAFMESPVEVQLQILTSCVKLFLKKTDEGSERLVQSVLVKATEDCVNPDIRDRGYMYWRLLSTDPDVARSVVLGERPPLEDDSMTYNPELLEVLMRNMSTLSSVLHKPPSAFCTQMRRMDVQRVDIPVEPLPDFGADGEDAEEDEAEEEEAEEEVDDFGGDLMSDAPAPAPAAADDGLGDLMDLLGGGAPTPSAPAPAAQQMGGSGGGAAKKVWLEPSAQTGGVRFSGSFRRQGGNMFVDVLAENTGQGVASGFAIQFNKNSFQLAPVANIDDVPPSNLPLTIQPLQPGQSGECSLLLNNKGTMQLMKPLMAIQMAIKSNAGLGYCQTELPMHVVQVEGESMSRDAFLQMWRSLDESCESKTQVTGISVKSPDDLKERFARHNLTEVARTKGQQGQSLQYFVAKLVNNILLLAEISVWAGGRAECCFKAKNGALSEPFHASIKEILMQ
jgi:AP-1 complex subunit beta-1